MHGLVALSLVTYMGAWPVSAQKYLDATEFALTLGGLLGAESACGLTYDIKIVEQYIAENADPADLTIASGLSMITRGTRLEFEAMSTTEKAAQCQLAVRSARVLGFIE
ncbi:MAG: hypothetical protein Q7J57_14930 [Gemmobacter sp.]|nr:hypothetical protein [Gemmobacter sp.]